MKESAYHIVDVFAKRRYTGNQLAVVLPEVTIDGATMQTIAREFNFSETTFILSREPRNGGYDVRIFTPGEEVPFAGHPVLGTAYIIRNMLLGGKTDTIVLNLPAGRIPVAFEGPSGIPWMTQLPPVFGESRPSGEAAALLGLAPGDADDRYPAQEVSTGLPFLILPLKGLDAVRRARPVSEACGEFFRGRPELPVFLFAPETCEPAHRLHARMFAPSLGVPEDPATGSACGCLGGYLLRHRYLGEGTIDISIEQGYEIGRESVLHLKAMDTADGMEIRVGGSVFPVATGTLR
ncbi:MAG: PhzF family phenazine biosynthesis protein [Spirochaetes bacterium]|nr:PhzF family phenazine biosynthesis protein [Spirochaetota bacterium]